MVLGQPAGDILRTQQALIKFKEGLIDVKHIVIALLDKIHDDHIKSAAGGQGITCPSDEIQGLVHIQFQRNGKSNGGGLGGLVIGIVPDLGEMLPGNIGLVIYLRVLLTAPVNELQ